MASKRHGDEKIYSVLGDMMSAENLPSGLSVFAVAEVVGPSPYPAKNMSSNTEVVKGENPTWNTSKISPLKLRRMLALCNCLWPADYAKSQDYRQG
jgi:hypothetical protein